MGLGWHESGSGRGEVRRVLCRRGRLPGLVVGGLVLFTVPGCFLVDPPEYVAPEKERPNLHVFDAEPVVTQVQVVELGVTNLPIRVPLTFRPSTQAVEWQLWRNLDLEGMYLVSLGALRNDATEIAFDLRITRDNGFSEGCQQLTLLVSSDPDDFGFETPRGPLLIEDRDNVAQMSWWLNVSPPPGEELTLFGCPGPKDLPE